MEKETKRKWQDTCPPKVKAMFGAVLELVAEGRDFSAIKVSEITARAGIGKGTAYEYFSTKEEIVFGALKYEAARDIGIISGFLREGRSFQEVVFKGMALMEEANEKYNGFAFLEKLMAEKGMVKSLLDEMERFEGEVCPIIGLTDEFAQRAYREGVITKTEPFKVQSALISQMVSYAFYLTHQEMYSSMETEEVRQFLYESILKILN